MMSMKVIRTMPFAFFMCVALVAGCSVKEDRSECPCVLMLDLTELDTAYVKSVNVLAVSADGVVLDDYVSAADFEAGYRKEVPHGFIQVNVWSDGGGTVGGSGVRSEDSGVQGRDAGRIVHIPYGVECPPVYLHSFVADTRGEACRECVHLNKNHCRLTVMMPDGSYVPYSLTFKGMVDGYDIRGMPSGGDFSCVAYPSDVGESCVVLPRQVDNSLVMEVDDGVPHTKRFAIGEYLDKGGYDWNAASLADVTVILDYTLTVVTIRIVGWEKEYVYDVIL